MTTIWSLHIYYYVWRNQSMARWFSNTYERNIAFNTLIFCSQGLACRLCKNLIPNTNITPLSSIIELGQPYTKITWFSKIRVMAVLVASSRWLAFDDGWRQWLRNFFLLSLLCQIKLGTKILHIYRVQYQSRENTLLQFIRQVLENLVKSFATQSHFDFL